MNKLLPLLLVVAICLMTNGVAHGDEPSVSDLSPRERTFVGGFLGLQLGSFTSISLNLHAGYRITNRFSAGLAGSYHFANDSWFGQSYSSHMYGGSVFARFRLYSTLFIHGEYERMRLESRLPPYDPQFDPDDRSTVTEDNYFLGAGYGIPLSERLRLNILALYNFNTESQAYLDNPFFRVGVDIFL